MTSPPDTRRILILSANPKGSKPLRLDEEKREIKEGLKRSKQRHLYSIETAEAVRYRDIHRAILDCEPHIIHFSGHGAGEDGLVFEDETGHFKLVDAEAIAGLFELFSDSVECVVLNACFSEVQAKEIARYINYVVGMKKAIGDKAAIEFAIGFYDALGADKGYKFAYKLGCQLIRVAGIPEHLTPQLLQRTHSPSQSHPNAPPKTELEYPDGHVPLNSPFYLQRNGIEPLCYDTLVKPGSLIRIKAPKLMGKTSLLARILHCGSEQNYRTVYLDLGGVDKAILADLDRFLRWLCQRVGDELNLENRVDKAWNTNILGSNDNCTAYFKKSILGAVDAPLVLGLDDIDRLFPHTEVVEDFFGMLRSWHEKGKFSPLWQKLRLVLAHSTEVYIPLDLNQSPFNAGVPIELQEFEPQQVRDLARRHDLKSPGKQLDELMERIGGHPYLVRLAMYCIGTGRVSLTQLLEEAATEAGIYSSHLRSLLNRLQDAPELTQALKTVVNSTHPVELDSIQIYRLHSLGLIKRQNNQVMPRCRLYREYFRRVL